MAWGQLGRYVSDVLSSLPSSSHQELHFADEGTRIAYGDELNLVLHKLLEYLGGSNSLVASCAFNEVCPT